MYLTSTLKFASKILHCSIGQGQHLTPSNAKWIRSPSRNMELKQTERFLSNILLHFLLHFFMILVTPGNCGHERMSTHKEVGADSTELNIPGEAPGAAPAVVFAACLTDCSGYSQRVCILSKLHALHHIPLGTCTTSE